MAHRIIIPLCAADNEEWSKLFPAHSWWQSLIKNKSAWKSPRKVWEFGLGGVCRWRIGWFANNQLQALSECQTKSFHPAESHANRWNFVDNAPITPNMADSRMKAERNFECQSHAKRWNSVGMEFPFRLHEANLISMWIKWTVDNGKKI